MAAHILAHRNADHNDSGRRKDYGGLYTDIQARFQTPRLHKLMTDTHSIVSDMAPQHKVLIIGAGITGSLTSALLRRQFKNIDLVVWEKSRGAGGRMTTSRSPGGDEGRADIGAQYISATPQYYSDHNSFYQELLSSSTVVPFNGIIEGERKEDGAVKHFIAPQGISAVVKYFLQQSEAKISYQTHCTDVSLFKQTGENARPAQWRCTDMKGKSSLFDSVIITTPVPQLLGLKGTIQELTDGKRELLDKVRYSSRYALTMFYGPGIKIGVPWTAKYVTGNSCIRFVSVDSRKRGQDANDSSGPSIVLHTSVQFGIQHLETDRKHVEELILENAKELLPDLPKPSSTKCHKWRYSQVSKPVEGSPGCLVLSKSPLLIAGGDAFTHSNVDGCVESVLSIVHNCVKYTISDN